MKLNPSFASAKAALINFLFLANLTAASPSNPVWQHARWQHPDTAHTTRENNDLSIKTSSGLIDGFVNSSYPGVRQFLGIPFAQPPLGALRFEPPEAIQNPNAHVNATATPHACPQIPKSNGSVFAMSAPEFFNSQEWNEDCLSLSIWAPQNMSDEKLPVVIWIHGQGLQQGSSSVPYQQPPAWIQRSQEHIVVALQYRLNIFGFPNGAGLNRTNLGLLDQRLGIEWVRDNIEAFGGDAERMILWGQSSGAASVDAQNFAFPDDPIVQGFISNSGSVLFAPGTGFGTVDPTHSNFTTVAKGLGCPSDPEAEASCMRTKPAEEIIDFLTRYSVGMTTPPLNFLATPDDIIAFSNYSGRYEQGRLSQKPVIFGTNANEGVAQVPLPPNPTVMGPNQTMADMATLALFQCPAYASAIQRAETKRKTYIYYYAGNFTDLSPLFWEGAYHMSELPQIFGTRGQYHAAASAYEVQTSNAMQDLWLGFAKSPGSPESVGWVDFASGELLVLGGGNDPVKKAKASDLDAKCAPLPTA